MLVCFNLCPWQFGLTAAHIVCKQGNLGIFSKIVTTAKAQKVLCTAKGRPELSSDYEVVLMTRAKQVLVNSVSVCVYYQLSLYYARAGIL